MKTASTIAATILLAAASTAAVAQSVGGSALDPNNERNQRVAPGETQPTDPAASDNPAARVPTDPGDAAAADRQPGGASGTGAASGEMGSNDDAIDNGDTGKLQDDNGMNADKE